MATFEDDAIDEVWQAGRSSTKPVHSPTLPATLPAAPASSRLPGRGGGGRLSCRPLSFASGKSVGGAQSRSQSRRPWTLGGLPQEPRETLGQVTVEGVVRVEGEGGG